MKIPHGCLALTLICVSLFSVTTLAAPKTTHEAPLSLAPALENFRPFINRTYRGEYRDEKSGNTAIDIAQWQRALNGQAIRVLHSIDEGQYGGETIFFYDKSTASVRFYYFTTAGFYTQGEVHFEGNIMVSKELVSGESSGITHVISKAKLEQNGNMIVDSSYMKGDIKVNASHSVYQPIEHTDPVFK